MLGRLPPGSSAGTYLAEPLNWREFLRKTLVGFYHDRPVERHSPVKKSGAIPD